MALKKIRYGTKYVPFSRDIIVSKPSPSYLKNCPIYFSNRKDSNGDVQLGKLPTISFIQGCMDDKKFLYLWQEKMIGLLGMPAFRKFVQNRLSQGIRFHAAARNMLVDKSRNKESTLSAILQKTDPSIHGYIQSLYPFISSLSLNESSTLAESNVVHPELRYGGRFDALFRYKDKLCMVDWKTTSAHSSVAKNVDADMESSGLYGYPRQLAAYVAAFNRDSSYFNMDQVRDAAVVLAYEDGREFKVIEIDSVQLEKSWKEFLSQMREFWKVVNSNRSGIVNFIYKG